MIAGHRPRQGRGRGQGFAPRRGHVNGRPPVAWRHRIGKLFGAVYQPRFSEAAVFAEELGKLFDDSIGTQLAIASCVRNLISRPEKPTTGKATKPA